jgi:hypothetical protein
MRLIRQEELSKKNLMTMLLLARSPHLLKNWKPCNSFINYIHISYMPQLFSTSSEIPIPEKALSGGTLFQRATQMAKVDGQVFWHLNTKVQKSQFQTQAYENEDGLEGGRSAGGGGGTFSSFSLAPLKKTSLLTATLLEGNARLGIMTEAHREAAVSEWRRKSQKELMRKQKQG